MNFKVSNLEESTGRGGFVALAVLILTAIYLQIALPSDNLTVNLIFGCVPTMVAVGCGWLAEYQRLQFLPWREVLDYRGIPGIAAILKSIGCCVGLLFLGGLAMSLLCSAFGISLENLPRQELLEVFGSATHLQKVIIAVQVVIVAPVCEEIVFRKLSYDSFAKYGSSVAIVLSSLIFAVMHLMPIFVPVLFALSLALFVARKLGGLPLAIAMHAGFNAISLLINYFQQMVN